jgi:hypothetical protein
MTFAQNNLQQHRFASAHSVATNQSMLSFEMAPKKKEIVVVDSSLKDYAGILRLKNNRGLLADDIFPPLALVLNGVWGGQTIINMVQ